QLYPFSNKLVLISDKGIESVDYRNLDTPIWVNKIKKHTIDVNKSRSFAISQDENGQYQIDIHSKASNYFKVLIQTSRLYWQKDMVGKEDKNKFKITSTKLTPEENAEQVYSLINKIYTVGYMLH
ncbi:hypothetical protein RZS08_32215, partial [Arthrospira platensis SPKY1]|nr:hypothetical protein [Arthrospira platensis SPKY1]